MQADINHHRAKVAAATRWGNEAEREQAQRDLEAAKTEVLIEKVEAEAASLTDEQRERLAALLTGGAK